MFEINEKDELIAGYDELKDYQLTIKVKKYRQKRSLDANSYAWALIEELAKKLNIPKLEVYKEHIKDVGVFRQIEIDEKAADTIALIWGQKGIGWISEKVDYSRHDGFVIYNLYYGSSVYNTKQMSRLIDNIIQDCKEQGIQTATPDEIEKYKSLWGEK